MPHYDDLPPPVFRPAPPPTAAEIATRRGRCCIPGCTLPGMYRAALVARPAGGAGGYEAFTTPHRVCHDHRESRMLDADLIARPSERTPLAAWAALRYGWDARAVEFSACAQGYHVA